MELKRQLNIIRTRTLQCELKQNCKVEHVEYVLLFFTVFATEYHRIIMFKEPIPSKALSGHVIRTEKVDDEGSCRLKCYLEPNCVSINVGPADEGRLTCE